MLSMFFYPWIANCFPSQKKDCVGVPQGGPPCDWKADYCVLSVEKNKVAYFFLFPVLPAQQTEGDVFNPYFTVTQSKRVVL